MFSWTPIRRMSFYLYRALRSIARAAGTTHQIALGLAIGLFVAWLPFEGFQMLTAAAIATALHANRALSVAAIWVTNPLTYVPIYSFNYWVGRNLVGGPPLSDVVTIIKKIFTPPVATPDMGLFAVWWDNIKHSFTELVSMGGDILIPLWIGGIGMGLIFSVITYYGAYLYVGYFRNAVTRKIQARNDRRTRRLELLSVTRMLPSANDDYADC